MTDDQFLAAFENCSLRGEHFHHADHVRMGFLYLCRFPALEALRRFSAALMNFAAANGKPDRYHETITWAFLLLIRERVARWCQQSGRQPSWDEFARDNSDLLDWKGNILRQYYRDEKMCIRDSRCAPSRRNGAHRGRRSDPGHPWTKDTPPQ